MPSICGIVLNLRSHKPLNGVTLYTRSSTFPDWGSLHATSDQHGSFEIRDVSPGIYSLHAQTEPITIGRTQYPFFGNVEGLEVAEDDLVCNVQVDVRGVLDGQVKDAVTGKPIRGAMIEFIEDTGGLFGSVSQEDGIYRFGQIIPGAYTISCDALGYGKFQEKIFIGDALEDGPVVLPIFLTPLPSNLIPTTGVVRGFVYNEMGNPALGVEITLMGGNVRRTMITSKNYFDYQSGNYEFYGVPEGSYTLTALKSGMHPAREEIVVLRGRDNWAPDLRLKSLPINTPPEIEYLIIEPRVLTAGEQLQIRLKFKGNLAKVAAASGTIWGPTGFSIGFTFERREVDGELHRSFDWTQPGSFVLSQLMVFNTDTGKGSELPVQAQFEVVPKQIAPLTPDSAIFRVTRE
jgi:hypothetical protein